MNLNKVFILGNLTRDPEIRVLPSGQQIATFGVATNRFYLDNLGEKKQETEFHNIVCFGKLADLSSRFLKKGSLVLIEGRIRTRNWINSQGLKQYRTEIIAQALQLGPKTAEEGKNIDEKLNTLQEEITDIPVIEENYLPPEETPSSEDTNEENNSPKENDDENEINVNEIPF